jgi:hypothetical protein
LSQSPALFDFVIFLIGSYVFVQAHLDCNPPIYASCVAGMTGSYHHTQLIG